MVCTQIQPIIGIANWKNENTPAIPHMRRNFMQGSFKPFAKDTENASIASPAPSAMLIIKNPKSICFLRSFFFFANKNPRAAKPHTVHNIEKEYTTGMPRKYKSRDLRQARSVTSMLTCYAKGARYSLIEYFVGMIIP